MNCKIPPKAENPRPHSSAPQTRSRATAAGKLPKKSARRAGNAALCGLQNRNEIYKSAFSIMRPDAVGDIRIKALLRPDSLRRQSHGAAPNFSLWRNYLPKAACGTDCRLKESPLFSTLLPNGRKKKAAVSRGLSKLHGGRDWIRTSERQSRTDLQSAPFSPLDTLPSCKLGFEHTLRDFRHKLFFQLF